jgi:hypothetical protein
MGFDIKQKIDFVKHYLDYNADIGVLIWKRARSNRAPAGSKAGCLNTTGYLVAQIDGQLMYCHHLAWVLHYNEWPSKEVDHVNGVRNDNRIVNLRLASSNQNKFNMRLNVRNTSGVKGVSWDDVRKKWAVSVKAGTKRYRRRFVDLELAEFVAQEVRLKLHEEFARHA